MGYEWNNHWVIVNGIPMEYEGNIHGMLFNTLRCHQMWRLKIPELNGGLVRCENHGTEWVIFQLQQGISYLVAECYGTICERRLPSGNLTQLWKITIFCR